VDATDAGMVPRVDHRPPLDVDDGDAANTGRPTIERGVDEPAFVTELRQEAAAHGVAGRRS
jgi:hypothetical protein